MTFTLEEERALASLASLVGYSVLVNKVVRLKKENALEKLKSARGTEEIVNAAMEYRVWDDVISTLEQTPKTAVENLKEQGDAIYG